MPELTQELENLPPLPTVTLSDNDLSDWMSPEACLDRRKRILDVLALEIALEKRDFERWHERFAEKDAAAVQAARNGDLDNERPDLIIECQEAENSMDSCLTFISALSATYAMMLETFPVGFEPFPPQT